LIGCLVNHLVLRARFLPGLTFAGLLDQAFACRRRADEHATLSLHTGLKRCLASGDVGRRAPTVNHHNLFRAVFSMRETPPLTRSFAGLTLTQLAIDEPILSCDLALSVIPDGKGLAAKLIYNRA